MCTQVDTSSDGVFFINLRGLYPRLSIVDQCFKRPGESSSNAALLDIITVESNGTGTETMRSRSLTGIIVPPLDSLLSTVSIRGDIPKWRHRAVRQAAVCLTSAGRKWWAESQIRSPPSSTRSLAAPWDNRLAQMQLYPPWDLFLYFCVCKTQEDIKKRFLLRF